MSFLDVFISGINNQNITLQAYHQSTFTGLLLNFESSSSFSYKLSLINSSFKICNNCKQLWANFPLSTSKRAPKKPSNIRVKVFEL